MANNSFGNIFRITTFGESHGVALGVVIDGCPSQVELTEEMIQKHVDRRRPGKNVYTSPRKEGDRVSILSGVFEGKTTGAPIALLLRNSDADPSAYAEIKGLYRPGHANFTYLQKYGIYDDRGGGRASARETAARVAAGAVAERVLLSQGISCTAFLSQVGSICLQDISHLKDLRDSTLSSEIFCPDKEIEEKMKAEIVAAKEEGDSVGGVVSVIAKVPPGLGDPIYAKLEALLAYAMLSLPASKGFEIGSGFAAAAMKGSEHNDSFTLNEAGEVSCKSNCAGGVLGGISTGEPLWFRTVFKPTSSIRKEVATVCHETRQKKSLVWPSSARHDPCVAVRAVPVVEAMTCLVSVDALLLQRIQPPQGPTGK